MKEIKSKKTGRIQQITEEEYAQLVKQEDIIKRFTVTTLNPRAIIPSMKPKKIQK